MKPPTAPTYGCDIPVFEYPPCGGVPASLNQIVAPTTPPIPAPQIPSVTSTTFRLPFGVAVNYQIVATNTPTSYAATGLPSGLTLNTITGVITGTPTSAGTTTSANISATNAEGTGYGILNFIVSKSVTFTSDDVIIGPFSTSINATIDGQAVFPVFNTAYPVWSSLAVTLAGSGSNASYGDGFTQAVRITFSSGVTATGSYGATVAMTTSDGAVSEVASENNEIDPANPAYVNVAASGVAVTVNKTFASPYTISSSFSMAQDFGVGSGHTVLRVSGSCYFNINIS